MRIRKTIFGRSKIKPNTFIGGVSATLNTPALVAAKLGISVSRIKAFSIIGNDIEFAVTGGSYVIRGSAFRDSNIITFYNDYEGLVTTIGTQAFRNTTSMTSVNLPNVISIGSYAFQSSSISGTIVFQYCTTLGENAFSVLTGSPIISFPALTLLLGAIDTFIYSSINTVINVPVSFMTSNSGKPNSNFTVPALGAVTINYIGYVADTSYNTEIGGVASVINSRSYLANIIGIGSGGIVNFQIIGSNIRFKILDKYQLKASAFSGDQNITHFNDIGENVTNVLNSVFLNSSVQWVKLNGIVNYTGYSSFRGCPNLTSLEMNKLKILSASFFVRNSALKIFSFPELTNITTTSVFYGEGESGGSGSTFYFPKCLQLGPTVGNDSVFYVTRLSSTITVNIALQTNNSGSPDGDLQYAITSRGATVNYII